MIVAGSYIILSTIQNVERPRNVTVIKKLASCNYTDPQGYGNTKQN
jgi:hypothetical protein